MNDEADKQGTAGEAAVQPGGAHKPSESGGETEAPPDVAASEWLDGRGAARVGAVGVSLEMNAPPADLGSPPSVDDAGVEIETPDSSDDIQPGDQNDVPDASQSVAEPEDARDAETPEASEPAAEDEAIAAAAAAPKAALEEDAPEEAPPQPATELTEKLAAVDRRLAELTRQLKDKDQTIASLFDDLQQSQKGVNITVLRPFFIKLGRVVAKISEDIEAAEAREDASLVAHLDAYRIEIINTLEDMGLIEEPETDLSEPPRFDTKTQRIRKVEYDDPALHQRIAKVVAPAFTFQGELVVPEVVDVYRGRTGANTEQGETH